MDIANELALQVRGPGDGPPSRQRAVAVAETFASIFAQQMVQQMRDSAALGGGEGMFGKGPGAGTYESWFDQHLARHLTTKGNMGLAEAMVRDWEHAGWIEPAADDPDVGILRDGDTARRLSLEV